MTWFVVGGVAIGATAGAIVGSEKGGDEVWKDALIGGAIGGTAGYGVGALAPAAEVAAPVVAEGAVAATPAVAAPAAGGIVAPELVGVGGSMAAETPAGIAMAESAAPTVAPAASTATTNAAANTATNTALKTAGEETAKKGILQTAFDSTLKSMSDHPFLTAGAAYFGLNALGAFNNQNEGQPFGTNTQTAAGYPMSPNFKPSREDPEKYRYTARYAAQGGIMGYAPGGMVQQDPMNPIQNPVYPQSQQDHTQFATSTQYPNTMAAAMGADYDTRTNPQTGQELPMGMASGGVAHFKQGREVYAGAAQEFAKMADRRLGASAPDTPDWVRSKGIYSDTDPSTRYKNASDAAVTRASALAKKYDISGPQLKVPTGGLGSISMGPVDREKKGTDTDSDEAFAAGGVARYADGGYLSGLTADQHGVIDMGTGTFPTNLGGGTNPFAASLATSAPAAQTSWGQGAQGYGSFGGGSSSSGNMGTGLATAGNNGVFPLEGQYGIIKMAGGGMARYATGGQPQNDDPVKTIVMMNQPKQENVFETNPALRHIAGLPPMPQQQEPSAFENPVIRHIAGQQVTQADVDAWNNRRQLAGGGISSLGGYAHGGNPRLLRGPGDGMSDDIPATIGGRQPARLADGEFVIPADVVSALGNGSTEAGAKHLHAMMDKTRQQAHGKKTQMKKVNPKKVMPA